MKKGYTKRIVSAIITMVLCLCIVTGSSFALFTDSDKVNVTVKSAKINVSATLNEQSLKTYSMGIEQTGIDENGSKLFANKGSASFDEAGNLLLDRVTPGDKATFTLNVKNQSNVSVLYRVIWDIEGALATDLIVKADDQKLIAKKSEWTEWDISNGYEKTVALSVELPIETTNSLQEQEAIISYAIEVVQGNADLPDEWNGSADYSWYQEDATVYELSSAEALAGFANLVAGNENARALDINLPVTFEGKTVNLTKDVDLYIEGENGEPISFSPIGTADNPFKGEFNGNDHTIANLYQSGWAFGYEWGSYGSIGLFGSVDNATVKNLTISGAESLVEGGDVGGITGSATGNCIFENISIEDSVFATYNNGNGGIIGWSGEGNYTFKNINIAEDVVLAGLWGSFDSSIGGVVGQGEPGATYNFENVNIACRLDVYNDCTASYDYYNYRMCGMIIGRLDQTTTIDGINYPDMSQYNITCNNVTVTYGNWANYHYCEPTPGYNNGRGMRVEPGYSYDGLPADYDHSQCVTNHNTLIPFDQIFGGAQLGVKGLKSFEGVFVEYNNQDLAE